MKDACTHLAMVLYISADETGNAPARVQASERSEARKSGSQLATLTLISPGRPLARCAQACADFVEGEAMIFLPLRGVYALGLLCLGCARWRGMLHREPPCNPRSRPPHLAAHTLRTQDRSEPLLAPELQHCAVRYEAVMKHHVVHTDLFLRHRPVEGV